MTKHRLKTSPFWAIAVVAALGMGLSACGGGSDGLSAAQQQAVDDAAKIQADKDAAQAAYDTAKMAIAEADTAAAAQAALDDVKDMITGMQIAELQGMVDDRITAIGMADSVTMQKDALMAAADMLDTSDLSTEGAITAAKAAIGVLDMALDDATDVSDADKAMYQTQLDTAEDAVAVAEHKMAIEDAAVMAVAAVRGVSDTSTDTEVASADSAVQAVKDAIADAADVLPMDDQSIVAATAALEVIEPILATAKTSRTTAMEEAGKEQAKENAALGNAMHKALGGPATDTTPPKYALSNIGTLTLAADLTIDAAAGAGALPDTGDGSNPGEVKLKAGASVGPLGSWNGMDYAKSDGKGTTLVTNEARVYTNQGPGKMVDFTAGSSGLAAVSDSKAFTIGDDADSKIAGSEFSTAGTKTHAKGEADELDNEVSISGKYAGASGTYRCEGACSSQYGANGLTLTGDWTFTPGTGAMVHDPDDNYLYYGWWVSKDHEGMPTAASAFAGANGVDGNVLTNAGDLTEAALTGSATYVGNAAGKFAMSNPLDGTGSAGHFTADAMLMAKFGGETASENDFGVTGTIDNFRLNDGSEDPGWSVALGRGGLGTDGGIVAPTTKPTVWSINGNEAPMSGTWSGTMYDEMPAGAANDDGSNIPTTVTGTFYSEFSTIGRMVGAFGANKQ